MDDELKIIGLMIGGIVVGIVLLCVAIMFGQYVYEKNLQCPRFADNVERPYKYDWFAGGCFVQAKNGQWVAEKNYWTNPVLSGNSH